MKDVYLEFCYMFEEIAEALQAYRRKEAHLGEELADVAIYLFGLAEILGIDIEDAINKKIVKNSKRTYLVIDGVLTKIEGESAPDNTVC